MPTYFTRFKPFHAPSSYTFIDPDTAHKYGPYPDKKGLFFAILSYRDQNNLPPIAALDTVLDHYWCSLPENRGKCESFKLQRSWMQYVKGGVALLENLFYGKDNLLTPAEAEKRAKVCVSCPENVFPDKDGFIKWSDELAVASTGGLKCPSYDSLGNCAVCSCPLRSLTFYKNAVAKDDEVDKLPKHCWKLTERKT
jgi:hypothetical protein